jgi:hypothetical protein
MEYICDAPGGKTWFRLVTQDEALSESEAMHHAVEKYFRREYEKAAQSFQPASRTFIEQEIGLKSHISHEMPMFLSLRDGDGAPCVTAMLPPRGRDGAGFRIIIVGANNSDPYAEQGEAIRALGQHCGIVLGPERCYPYHRAQSGS